MAPGARKTSPHTCIRFAAGAQSEACAAGPLGNSQRAFARAAGRCAGCLGTGFANKLDGGRKSSDLGGGLASLFPLSPKDRLCSNRPQNPPSRATGRCCAGSARGAPTRRPSFTSATRTDSAPISGRRRFDFGSVGGGRGADALEAGRTHSDSLTIFVDNPPRACSIQVVVRNVAFNRSLPNSPSLKTGERRMAGRKQLEPRAWHGMAWR